MSNLIGLLEFYVTHSELLLTACPDQSLYSLSLIKLSSPSSLIINFEQVIKSFLVWNIYYTFLVDCTFLKGNYVLLSCHVRVSE